MNFKNKNVIITGASSGIGKAISRKLANKGANITLVSRTQKKLNETREELINNYHISEKSVFVEVIDVSCREQVRKGDANKLFWISVYDKRNITLFKGK